MSDTPKVGKEGWAWRGSDSTLYPCKILEFNTDDHGQTRYFVSYDSPAMGRRCMITVSRHSLVKVPVKVVTYQLMSADGHDYVVVLGCTATKGVSEQWCRAPRYHNRKLFIQRTEVTGDKIEVFVERVL